MKLNLFSRFQSKRSLVVMGIFVVLEGVVLTSFFVVVDGFQTNAIANFPDVTAIHHVFPIHEKDAAGTFYLDRFGDERNFLLSSQLEFLEINFSKDQVIKYEDGKIAQEVPILAKGDPQGWGGTPSGIYKALNKYVDAYSGVSLVYMPYAIHFYGKYYLHGEPYYSWGEKLASDTSGGCIRLEDQNAKVIFESVKKDMPVLVVDKENDGYEYVASSKTAPPIISAPSYLVADVNSGFVFAEKGSKDVRPIASITKLMTSLIVTENVDLRRSVEVTQEMLDNGYGATEGLEAGNSYRVVELLYPLLISSSNDAAEAMAGFMGRDKTIQMMNDKAANMLMQDTAFTDPSGYDPGNVSTAQDLFYLARYVLHNRPPLFEITKGNDVRSFGEVSFAKADLWNKNVFAEDPSFAGGKTGYIIASKHTGIFLFNFLTKEGDVRTIAFVVLGTQNDKLDVQRLYGWLQQKYNLTPDYQNQKQQDVLLSQAS